MRVRAGRSWWRQLRLFSIGGALRVCDSELSLPPARRRLRQRLRQSLRDSGHRVTPTLPYQAVPATVPVRLPACQCNPAAAQRVIDSRLRSRLGVTHSQSGSAQGATGSSSRFDAEILGGARTQRRGTRARAAARAVLQHARNLVHTSRRRRALAHPQTRRSPFPTASNKLVLLLWAEEERHPDQLPAAAFHRPVPALAPLGSGAHWATGKARREACVVCAFGSDTREGARQRA